MRTDGFEVNTSELHALATALRSQVGGSNTDAAQAYVTKWLTVTWAQTGPVFAEAAHKINDCRTTINTYLKQLDDAITATASELDKQANYYDTMDEGEAAKLDSTYVGSNPIVSAPVPPPVCPTPTACLTEPSGDTTVTNNVFDSLRDALSTISPTGLVATIVKKISGHDLFAELVSKFTGDWHVVQEAANAIRDIESYLQTSHTAVRVAWHDTIKTWEGNAAEDAFSFLTTFGKQLDETADDIDPAANTLDAAAVAMYQAASAAGSALSSLLDLTIVGAIVNGIGAATAETGVGPAAAALIDILLSLGASRLVDDLADSAKAADNVYKELAEAAGAAGMLVGPLAKAPVPQSWDSPEV
jgi:hypothetical protein